MKNPFDRIVGPDGVWMADGEPVDDYGLTAREAFALKCLNAAANLYGILTLDEFATLYNLYAQDHESSIAHRMSVEDLNDMIGRLIEVCKGAEDESDSIDDILDRPECWFDIWDYKKTGQRLIVQDMFTSIGSDGTPMTPKEREAKVRRQADGMISRTLKDFVKVEMKVLPEADFFEYEEPTYSEETSETKKFEKFLVRAYDLPEDLAGLDLWGIQGEVRCNGVSMTVALEYVRDCCEWAPRSEEDFDRLIREISPVIGITRTWTYRGHTDREMCQLGLIDRYEREDIPDVFGLLGDEGAADDDNFYLDDLPKPVYTGPIDFKFVKDPARREAKMEVYENVRQILDEFIEKHLGQEFKSVFDDASAATIQRLAKRKKKLDGFEQLALEYFSTVRYTWLLIEAVKAGYGMKCRDLMTGDELFLIDKTGSAGDIKGRTLCLGIVPMEDVYIASGTGTLVYLQDPEAELNAVLARIGVNNTRPVKLSFPEQARFVAETFHHLKAIGHTI